MFPGTSCVYKMRSVLSLLSLFLALTCSFPLEDRPLSCRDFKTRVNVSARNKVLHKALSIKDLTSSFLNDVVAALPTALVSGEYTMAGRYCEPLNDVKSRRQTLQVLVHGLTYNVNYWSGLAPPNTRPGQRKLSWLHYAAEQGYPTLSVDRLCSGNSSKPNGIAECQLPLETEAMNAVLRQARAGTIPGVPRKFSKIVYVGHSYGSQTANALSLQHPKTVDAYVLTGFSEGVTRGEPGAVSRPLFLPAKEVDPVGHTDFHDPAYTMASEREGDIGIFYHGNYSREVALYDWRNRGTFQVGEGATVQLGQVRAPEYTGHLFVMNGNNDLIFCARNSLQNLLGTRGDCAGGKFSERVKKFYPKVASFEFLNIPDTGHCLQLHHSAPVAWKAAHDFMERHGF